MIHPLIGEQWLLDKLLEEHEELSTMSPEELLVALEHMSIEDELTETEVTQYLADLFSRNPSNQKR